MTDDAEAVSAAFDRGVLGTAAELLGLSRAMLELTVAYARQRHQFGRPIGSFQAVKHHLANARIQIEFAGPAVAVRRLCRRPRPAGREPQRVAGQVARQRRGHHRGRAALQCHGAIGYTTEYGPSPLPEAFMGAGRLLGRSGLPRRPRRRLDRTVTNAPYWLRTSGGRQRWTLRTRPPTSRHSTSTETW